METPPDFPYPLVAVPGARSLQAWKHYQSLWRQEGCSAVLLGNAQEVTDLKWHFDRTNIDPRSLLEEAESISWEKLLLRPGGYFPDDDADKQRDPHEISDKHASGIAYLCEIPTDKPHEIPAYLHWGGWNECPTPAEHVAVLRHWNEKYGIEIYSLTHDTMECTVERPPTDRQAAVDLSHEQVMYCSDIAGQVYGSLPALASVLQDAHAWFFWWD